jgi:hypothetical protein
MSVISRREVGLLHADDVEVLLGPVLNQAVQVAQEAPDIVGGDAQAGGKPALGW